MQDVDGASDCESAEDEEGHQHARKKEREHGACAGQACRNAQG